MTKKLSKAGSKILAGAREARAYARGEDVPGAAVHAVDVAAIRAKTGLTQAKFAQRFKLDVNAVRSWEQKKRTPDRAAQLYLKVIETEPEAVDRALKARSA